MARSAVRRTAGNTSIEARRIQRQAAGRVEAGEVARLHRQRAGRAADPGGEGNDLRVLAVEAAERGPQVAGSRYFRSLVKPQGDELLIASPAAPFGHGIHY